VHVRPRERAYVGMQGGEPMTDFDSVIIHYRFKPTGAVGQMVTEHGRKDAQEYIDAMTANDPRYEFWLVELPVDEVNR
jgi:hypothetical protein